MKRAIMWFITNMVMATACYFALVAESKGAGRIFLFLTYYGLFCWVAVTFGIDGAKDKIRAKGRSVPAWLSHGVGIGVILACLWHGWVLAAIAWVITESLEAATFSEDPELEYQNQNPPEQA